MKAELLLSSFFIFPNLDFSMGRGRLKQKSSFFLSFSASVEQTDQPDRDLILPWFLDFGKQLVAVIALSIGMGLLRERH